MTKLLRSLRYAIPLFLFLMLAWFLWQGLGEDPNNIPSVLIGKAVPTFKVETLLKPNSTFSNKEFVGHVSLLNVWATWCLSCGAEHSVLMDIAADKVVKIYGLDYKDSRSDAHRWLDKRGNPYTVIAFDPKGQLAINFGVYGTPETFIIDKKGVVRYKYIGPISPEVWRDDIKPLVLKLQKISL